MINSTSVFTCFRYTDSWRTGGKVYKKRKTLLTEIRRVKINGLTLRLMSVTGWLSNCFSPCSFASLSFNRFAFIILLGKSIHETHIYPYIRTE